MPARYSRVAIWLHWSIAALMLPLFVSGPLMEELIENRATLLLGGIVYALHKSLGLTVLALSLLRLGWRLANPPPPLPAATPRWQALAARATHAAFYVVMIGAPLAGWALVSWSEVQVPTEWFGLFTVPHLPPAPRFAGEAAEELHGALGWLGIGLFALHVAAALWHLRARDGTAARMGLGRG
jgi:cytochrome b561